MSNDNRSDDDFIAQLYDSSKNEGEPPAALDSLILSSAKQTAVERVSEDANSTVEGTPNIVSLGRDSGSKTKTQKNETQKITKRWHMPNSLAACLIVSVMVGLIYRENAGQLTISDSVQVDYYAPVVTGSEDKDRVDSERFDKASAKAKTDFPVVEALGAVTKVQSEDLAFKAEARRLPEPEVMRQKSSSLADEAVMVEAIGSSVRLEESNVMAGAAPSISGSSVSESTVVPPAKERVIKPTPDLRMEFKAKKMMQKSERAMSLEADSEYLEARINQIRELRDSGDLGGALKVLNHVISQYPDVTLPDDIAALKPGLSAAE